MILAFARFRLRLCLQTINNYIQPTTPTMKLSTFFLAGLLSLSVFSLAAQSVQPPPSLPPNAEPNKCYAICAIPNVYDTYTETIEIEAARQTTLVAVPEYETVRMRIATQPAHTRSVYVPAVYETKMERIEIKPATTRYEIIPARYEEQEERVMVSEASKAYETSAPSFETVTNANLYYGNTRGLSEDYGNLLDPNNPNNPNMPDSPFNPNNSDSPYNPDNPNSPFNPDNPYNVQNPDNVLNPDNPDSPYNPNNVATRGLNDNSNAADEIIPLTGAGTSLPYIIRESSVKVERLPRTYENISDEIEVQAAYTKLVQAPGNCVDNPNCITWCEVTVPAEYQTVNRRVAKACQEGYTVGTATTGGDDFCVRLSYIPAEFGARSIMTTEPQIVEKVIAPRYVTIKKTVLVEPATVKEITVPAEYRDLETQVISQAAYTRQEVVPAEYKTVSRRVRKGMGSAEYIDPTGTLFLPSAYDEAGNVIPGTFPSMVNPATGLSLPEATTRGILGEGQPNSGTMSAGNNGSLNTGATPGGLPDSYYTSGCPTDYRFDPLDNTCKKTLNIPAVTETITKRRLSKAGGYSEWQEVLCPENVSSATVRQIQLALRKAGYDPGPADNVMGERTKIALAKYQRDNGLPVGGINVATARALGIQ